MKANLKNLFLILAVAVPFLFVSCDGTEDDAAEITIKFNSNGVFASGDAVAGTITSVDEALTKVVILKDNNAVKTITSFNALPILKGTDGVYTISITDLADGSYTMRAESKTGETSKDFTIGTAEEEIDWTKGKNTISANGAYAYKQGSTIGELVVSELSATSVKVALDGKAAVTLGDGASEKSYLLKDGTAASQSEVTGNNFLLAKSKGAAQIVDKDGLKTAIEGATGVLFVAK